MQINYISTELLQQKTLISIIIKYNITEQKYSYLQFFTESCGNQKYHAVNSSSHKAVHINWPNLQKLSTRLWQYYTYLHNNQSQKIHVSF